MSTYFFTSRQNERSTLFHSQSRGLYRNPQQRQKHGIILKKQAKTFLRKKYEERLADLAHVIVSIPLQCNLQIKDMLEQGVLSFMEVSFIWRLKRTVIIGIGTSSFVLHREVCFIRGSTLLMVILKITPLCL